MVYQWQNKSVPNSSRAFLIYYLVSQTPWCLFSHRSKYERWCFSLLSYLFQPAISDHQICFSLVAECACIVCMYGGHLCLDVSCKWPFQRGIAGADGLKLLHLHVCMHMAKVYWTMMPTIAVFVYIFVLADLLCLFGVTSDVSHLWMINMGDGIMKFSSQAEQAQHTCRHLLLSSRLPLFIAVGFRARRR